MGQTSQSAFAHARASLIAADVGGTHARVALLDAGPGGRDDFAILHYRKYACADYPSLSAIIEDFRATVDGGDVDRIALALAGYVIDDAVVNVNLPWTVSISELRRALGVGELAIVNDFEAVAHAIGHADASGATLLAGPVEAPLPGPMLVVGPGTGLGAALRIPHHDRPVILATEAGQSTLAAYTDLEFRLLRELRQHTPRVQMEHVLSGTGLANLHRAIGALRGAPVAKLSPAEITAAALSKSDDVAAETVDVFCGWLGAVLGDLALIYGAEGGIYLAGGVLPQMKELLVASAFVERFLDKGVMRHVLAQTPVRLVEHAQLGVIGAASWYLGRHPVDARAAREASHA
ncbi:MAG TPA: glucokinase [Rhodanobacteraceae bacterium]|nr:glucokinase [Rhodanobacteraceae bacterium]